MTHRATMNPMAIAGFRPHGLTIGLATVAFIVFSNPGNPACVPDNPGKERPATGTIAFREVAANAGVCFRFDTGSRGRHDLPEIMGGGVAVFDADGDGRLDIYLCNGGPIEPHPASPTHRAGSIGTGGNGIFKTSPIGPARRGRAMRWERPPAISTATAASTSSLPAGATSGFIATWAAAFQDVTVRAGLTSSLWSTSAAFADLDGDGDLDLYVATYLDFDPKSSPYCAAPMASATTADPKTFPRSPIGFIATTAMAPLRMSPDRLESTGPKAGAWASSSPSSRDNRPDIYVANDGTPCWLFANQGNLRFEEVAEVAGVARDGQGHALAGHGSRPGRPGR